MRVLIDATEEIWCGASQMDLQYAELLWLLNIVPHHQSVGLFNSPTHALLRNVNMLPQQPEHDWIYFVVAVVSNRDSWAMFQSKQILPAVDSYCKWNVFSVSFTIQFRIIIVSFSINTNHHPLYTDLMFNLLAVPKLLGNVLTVGARSQWLGPQLLPACFTTHTAPSSPISSNQLEISEFILMLITIML